MLAPAVRHMNVLSIPVACPAPAPWSSIFTLQAFLTRAESCTVLGLATHLVGTKLILPPKEEDNLILESPVCLVRRAARTDAWSEMRATDGCQLQLYLAPQHNNSYGCGLRANHAYLARSTNFLYS